MAINLVCKKNLVKNQGEDDVYVVRLTPVDCFGYAKKCCYVIPLKAGACIVCFFSFLWAVAEFAGTNHQVADIFPDRDSAWFIGTKVIYFILSFCLTLSTCVLMMGIIQERYKLVNYYVWFVSFYTVVFVARALVSFTRVALRTGSAPRRQVFRMAAVVVWACMLTYFLGVTNSYKYTLWRSLIREF